MIFALFLQLFIIVSAVKPALAATKKPTPVAPALIQNSIVRACDQINNHSQPACPYARKAAITTVPPTALAITAPPAPPVPLNRCDPERKDAPRASQIKNSNGAAVPMSTLEADEADQTFQYVNKQKGRYALAANSPKEMVCRERSHLIGFDLADICKVKSAKIFVQPSRSAWSLYMGRRALEVDARGIHHRWDNFHVANVIMVNKNGEAKPYVLDPILFDQAVPLAEWKSLLTKNDSSASFTVTSASTFDMSQADVDDPSASINEGIAMQNMEKAKAMFRKMNKP